jgi:hypothetical protein
LSAIRRRLGIVVVALTLLQASSAAAAAVIGARIAFAADDECCAKGSHPPGMCPLHRRAASHRTGDPSATCRLSCAASTAGPVTLMSAMTPSPVFSLVAPAVIVVDYPTGDSLPIDTAFLALTPPPRI